MRRLIHLTLASTLLSLPLLADPFGDVWYQGEAEVTTYDLEQARYGEIHPGQATLIFVTEDFSPGAQVKVDRPRPDAVKVMKLNLVKKFDTGVYPYSMMTSAFVPVDAPAGPALKVTTSSQEWCGHTFTQLNRKTDGYRFRQMSYFESEGDVDIALPDALPEDQLWITLRLDPSALPEGEVDLIPGQMFSRLRHLEPRVHRARAWRERDGELATYRLTYPDLGRTLEIRYRAEFPYEIEGWEETYRSGWGPGAAVLTTSASRRERRMLDYWNRHDREDAGLRTELGLD